MLVAVALIVLMMTLFATIFEMATKTMSTQKGLTENDQRVRLAVTMLRNDLGSTDLDAVTNTKIRAHRTFKLLIPYAAGETVAPWNSFSKTPGAAIQLDRSGYFMISEGNPADDTDDYLQFTITVPTSSNDRIFGRASALLTDAAGNYGTGNTNPANPPYWANQPAFDAQFSIPPLQAGSSTTAEVSYFLRNGTLYRRVMLIRVPNVLNPKDDHTPYDDSETNPLPITATANSGYVNGTKSFWGDFDYSAFYDFTNAPPAVTFHGLSDLAPTGAAIPPLINPQFVNPQFRWGFDNTTNVGNTPPYGGGYGLPKEFIGTTYFGRYTHAETSDPAFGFPARITGLAGNPMASTNAALGYNAATGRVQYDSGGGTFVDFNGPRAGEDALMTNVVAFDIKVWDPAASLGPDGKPGIAGFDDDGINGMDDYGELGAFGSDDGDWRDIGHAGYTPPNPPPFTVPPAPQQQPPYGFYRALPVAQNPNSYYSNPFPAAGTPPTNRFDTWGPAVEIDGNPQTDAFGNPIYDNPPFRPIYAGKDGRPGVAGVDDLGSTVGTDDATELGTPGSDDFAPLTAIKITIRFYDTTSKQVRDISGVYRLIFAD